MGAWGGSMVAPFRMEPGEEGGSKNKRESLGSQKRKTKWDAAPQRNPLQEYFLRP